MKSPDGTMVVFRGLKLFAFTVAFWGSIWAHANNVTKLGPLEAVVIENLKGAPYVVYLHGYGGIGESAYEDLKSEIENSEALKRLNWIFPSAPKGSWFAIEVTDQNGLPDIAAWDATLKVARKNLKEMIKAAQINPKKIIWAGFSQGAITAVDFVLHSDEKPMALIVNSGLYYETKSWKKKGRSYNGIPFFMSHDRRDEMLPFDFAKKLESILLENGFVGKLQVNRAGHKIPRGFMKKSITSLLDSNCNKLLKN